MEDIARYLEKLENLIDPKHVERTSELQKRAFSFESIDHIPTHIEYPLQPDEWPAFTYLEIFNDPYKMLLNELHGIYAGAKLKDDRLYGIRANYGTGIVSSLFGCQIRTFEDTLPIGLSVQPYELKQILDNGIPDIHTGIAGRALQTAAFYREMLAPYPKLSKYVGSQMLDIQGPFDNASIIWGSDIFYAVIDEPEKVMRLMEIVTAAIKALVLEHRRIDSRSIDEHDGSWNYLGGLCIRNDSSINLSGDQYRNLVKQYDQSLLEWAGGWVHFCGKAHQWWEQLLDINGCRGINPYQGEFYDLHDLYLKCKDANIPVVQWSVPVNKKCQELIKTGFSRIAFASDYDTALRMRNHLYETGHVDP